MSNIIREPIRLSHNAVAVIHVFSRLDSLRDLWMIDSEDYLTEDWEVETRAAKQFLEQLDGQYNIRFLQALRKECDLYIKEWEDRCNKEKDDE